MASFKQFRRQNKREKDFLQAKYQSIAVRLVQQKQTVPRLQLT